MSKKCSGEAGIIEGQGTAGEEEEKKKTKERWKRSNKTKKEDCHKRL